MLQPVYGEYVLKERTVFKRVQRFRERCENPKDDASLGRPSSSIGKVNIDHVRSPVLGDCRLTVRMIAEKLRLDKSSIHLILTENLEMKYVWAKIVPKQLTPQEKLRRKVCCVDWKTSEEGDEFLGRNITGDESWIYEYDMEQRVETEKFTDTEKITEKK